MTKFKSIIIIGIAANNLINHYELYLSFSGGSDDWAAGSLGIPFSYTIELPDTGRHGFVLPANRIESVGKEAFAGLEAMVQELIRSGGR